MNESKPDTQRVKIALSSDRGLSEPGIRSAIAAMFDSGPGVARRLNDAMRSSPEEYAAAAEIFDIYHHLAQTFPNDPANALLHEASFWEDRGFVVEGVEAWLSHGVMDPEWALTIQRLVQVDPGHHDFAAVAMAHGVDLAWHRERMDTRQRGSA